MKVISRVPDVGTEITFRVASLPVDTLFVFHAAIDCIFDGSSLSVVKSVATVLSYSELINRHLNLELALKLPLADDFDFFSDDGVRTVGTEARFIFPDLFIVVIIDS